MKQILIALVIFGFVSAPAQAQHVSGFAELQTTADADTATPQLNVYLRGPLKGKLGWTAWTLTSKEWSEGLVGLAFAPASWIELQGLVGVETDENPLRAGGNLWLGKGRMSLLVLQEYGGSGYWYRTLGTFEVKKGTLIGINSARFLGTGPYIEQKFGKVSVWGTYAVDKKKGAVTGRFSF